MLEAKACRSRNITILAKKLKWRFGYFLWSCFFLPRSFSETRTDYWKRTAIIWELFCVVRYARTSSAYTHYTAMSDQDLGRFPFLRCRIYIMASKRIKPFNKKSLTPEYLANNAFFENRKYWRNWNDRFLFYMYLYGCANCNRKGTLPQKAPQKSCYYGVV